MNNESLVSCDTVKLNELAIHMVKSGLIMINYGIIYGSSKFMILPIQLYFVPRYCTCTYNVTWEAKEV